MATNTRWKIGLLASLSLLICLVAGIVRDGAGASAVRKGTGVAPKSPDRPGAWQILGPGGGGALFAPAISPHNQNFVAVACDMSGFYISRDGGGSWRMVNLWSRVRQFVFDPINPKALYALNMGLWRSEDEGNSWTLVFPKARGLEFVGDDEAPPIFTGPGIGRASALAIDPNNSNALYLASANNLYISKNRGQNWEEAGRVSTAIQAIYVEPASPVKSRMLYLIGSNWAGRWQSGKLLDSVNPEGASWIYGSAAGARPGAPALSLYILTDYRLRGGVMTGGLLTSRDGAKSWTQANDGLLRLCAPGSNPPDLRAIAVAAYDPNQIYLSYSHLTSAEYGSQSRYFGVARSQNGGASWTLEWKENSSKAANNIRDAWADESFGADWAENPLALSVAPGNPDVAVGTDYARTMMTSDGGKTWREAYSQRTPNASYSSRGIDVTTCYGIHFDPFNKNRMIISYTDIGPFLSEDGGASWSSVRQGIPRQWRNTTYWTVFDPQLRGRVWAATSQVHDLPRLKMFRRKSPESFKGGVVISADGGRSWRPANRGMPETAVTHLVLDPGSNAEKRILYAAGFGHGVYKSTNGGQDWALKSQGLPEAPLVWRLTLDRGGILYAVLIRRSFDGGHGNAQDGMLFRSRNGAENWERMSLPSGVNGPCGIAVDPEDGRRLYLAAWERYREGFAHSSAGVGGVYLSVDSGQSWKHILSTYQYVYDVSVDPQHSERVFAATFEASILASTDRGMSWRRIHGYNFKAAHRVIPDPYNPDLIYVPTYGASVWHGPLAGDPAAEEDIAGPAQVRFSRNETTRAGKNSGRR